MGARVLFRDSQGRDGQFDLNPAATLYVGRALDCAVRTDDAMVSRKHSMIRMENGRFYVEDLGSSNGTHVNDVRITKHPLSHNDVVRCGSLWLRYVEDGPLVAPIELPERPRVSTQRPDPGDYGLPPGGFAGQGWQGGGGRGAMGGPTSQGQGTARPPAHARPGMGPAVGAGAGPGPAYPGPQAGAGPGPGHVPGGHGSRPIPGGPVGGGPQFGGGAPPGDAVPQGPLGHGAGSGGSGYTGQPYQGPGHHPAQPVDRGGSLGRPGRAAEPGGSDSAYQLFGGPPAMPSPEGIVGGDFITPPRSTGPAIGDEDSIVVAFSERDAARLHKELDKALRTVERLQIAYDREVADGKRLRAEIVTHEDRHDELRRAVAERDEMVEAHGRVADELREELRQAKDSLAAARTQESELADRVAARERQLARNQEDIGQLEREIQDKQRELAEVSRTKDDGWRRLNEQLTEIEHLREVINQQERMLEERRVGLIGQEEIIRELRAEKEQHLRETAQIVAEREELRISIGRVTAQVAAIDEENRRLTQLLTELRGERGPGGEEDRAAAAQAAAVSAELKTLRIALKTIESDRDHLKGLSERAENEVERLRERVAKLEVELREAHEERDRIQAGQSVSEDAMTRAELARHRAVEEAVAAVRARDDSAELAAELQRELDRVRRRLVELEDDTQSQAAPTEALMEKNRRLERKLAEASSDIAALEREVRTARAEMDAARKRSGATASRSVVQPREDGHDTDRTAAISAGRNASDIRDRAIEVHDGINDVLSELRSNAMILHGEFHKGPAELSPESSRIMKEAIESLLGQAEEAKRVLRGLRELVEFGDE